MPAADTEIDSDICKNAELVQPDKGRVINGCYLT